MAMTVSLAGLVVVAVGAYLAVGGPKPADPSAASAPLARPLTKDERELLLKLARITSDVGIKGAEVDVEGRLTPTEVVTLQDLPRGPALRQGLWTGFSTLHKALRDAVAADADGKTKRGMEIRNAVVWAVSGLTNALVAGNVEAALEALKEIRAASERDWPITDVPDGYRDSVVERPAPPQSK